FLKAAREKDPDAAIIILTGVGDVKTAIESLKHGAHDFILKPVNVEELLIAAERALERRELLIERREYQVTLERRVEEATRDLDAAYTKLQDTYRATLEALGSALDTRDVGTQSHSRRVHGYSLSIARTHGVPGHQLEDLEQGVLLHDIGKIGIPDAILLKPGPLTPEEWKIMRTHPEIGKRLIERIPFLRGAVPVVWCHHERWDGTGYPRGLRRKEIPLAARIFAVADAFDAMTFDRPYSRAISFAAARTEVQRCAATHFDPAVVATFLSIPESLVEDIRRRSLEPSNTCTRLGHARRTPPEGGGARARLGAVAGCTGVRVREGPRRQRRRARRRGLAPPLAADPRRPSGSVDEPAGHAPLSAGAARRRSRLPHRRRHPRGRDPRQLRLPPRAGRPDGRRVCGRRDRTRRPGRDRAPERAAPDRLLPGGGRGGDGGATQPRLPPGGVRLLPGRHRRAAPRGRPGRRRGGATGGQRADPRPHRRPRRDGGGRDRRARPRALGRDALAGRRGAGPPHERQHGAPQ